MSEKTAEACRKKRWAIRLIREHVETKLKMPSKMMTKDEFNVRSTKRYAALEIAYRLENDNEPTLQTIENYIFEMSKYARMSRCQEQREVFDISASVGSDLLEILSDILGGSYEDESVG